jgi:predicted RNA-binding Zn-ribbon protein involved in translation (DUF1610 family)
MKWLIVRSQGATVCPACKASVRSHSASHICPRCEEWGEAETPHRRDDSTGLVGKEEFVANPAEESS